MLQRNVSLYKANVLFYGGCHAQVLHEIFTKYGMRSEATYDRIINFKLIGAKQPFPYENLQKYTDVVFSPILHNSSYHTDHLVEQCRRLGINTVCFPWLQWNGYFPYISKDTFVDIPEWWHSRIPGLHEKFAFEKLDDLLNDAFSNSRLIQQNFEATTELLRGRERNGNSDIIISDYILNNYKRARLFLSPDHPSKELYNYVAREISVRLGIPIDDSFYWSARECQTEARVPIVPKLSEQLGLSFVDGDFSHVMTGAGIRHIGFSEYKRLVYGVSQGAKVFRSTNRTFIKAKPLQSPELSDAEKVLINPGAIIQIINPEFQEPHISGEFNWLAVGGAWQRLPLETGFIYAPHWEPVKAA